MARYFSDVLDYDRGTPRELYDLYLDAGKHAFVYHKFIDPKDVKIGKRAGTRVRLYNGTSYHGFIRGRNLALIPGRMIVQALRSDSWDDDRKDAIVVMTFAPFFDLTRVKLVNANLPEHELQVVDRGMFFDLWRVFIRGDDLYPPEIPPGVPFSENAGEAEEAPRAADSPLETEAPGVAGADGADAPGAPRAGTASGR